MAHNWFKKTKISQVLNSKDGILQEDIDIIKGPKESTPRYKKGMKVRDRRKGTVNPQEYGVVDRIEGNKMKIIWNPDNKESKREEIFDMVENTEILSFIVAEV